MTTRKYFALLLAILICTLSGCGSKKSEATSSTNVLATTGTTLPQETTAPELPQDEKMDLLSFADQTPEQTTSVEDSASVPAATEAAKETTPVSAETAPEFDPPAITTPEGETIPLISGNADQLPLG